MGGRKMQRSRHGVQAVVVVLLGLSVLGCTGGRPGADRAELQADTEASTALEPSGSTVAGEGDGQASDATAAPASAAGSGGPSAAGRGGGNQAPGAPVGPGNRNNQPLARGAPIDVPRFEQIGAPIGEVFSSIEAKFAAVCGGRLCVKLVIRPPDADRESCGFAGTDPTAGTPVQRGTTVALLCTPAATESSDTTTPDNTDPTDTTTTPDDTTQSGDSQSTTSS
jgi:hypothetical protein